MQSNPTQTWLVDTYRTAHGRQIATRNFFKSKILYFAHRLCSIMQIFLSRDELFMDPTYSGDLCKTNYWVGRYSGLKKKLYGYYTVFPGDLWEVQSNTLWCCCFWCCRTEQLQHPQTNRPGLLLYWHVMWCDVMWTECQLVSITETGREKLRIFHLMWKLFRCVISTLLVLSVRNLLQIQRDKNSLMLYLQRCNLE